jgi:hypothetical protein
MSIVEILEAMGRMQLVDLARLLLPNPSTSALNKGGERDGE